MEAWRERAPEGFLYSVKFSRYGSHMKNLQAPGETIPNFVSRVRLLGDHLGPVLVQLPPRWHADPERLDAFLSRALDVYAYFNNEPGGHAVSNAGDPGRYVRRALEREGA